MVTMIVDVPCRVRIAAFTKINFTCVQSQPGGPGRARHFKRGAFKGIKEIIVVVLMGFDAFARPERELPYPHAVIFEYQLGSDFCHNGLQGNASMPSSLQRPVHRRTVRSAYTGITEPTIAAS